MIRSEREKPRIDNIWLEDRKKPYADVTPECSSPERKKRSTETENSLGKRPYNRFWQDIEMKDQVKTEKKLAKIWIIGCSYIKRGEEAANQIFGQNFGLNAEVEWFGLVGLRWRSVLPRLYREMCRQSPPDILVFHAGGNDLGRVSAKDLELRMQQDLRQLHEKFPTMKLVYSCINERKVWRTGHPGIINNDRKMVNNQIRKALGHFGGEVIEHPDLCYFDRTIYLPDGVNFTKKGNAVFLSSIHGALQKILNVNSRCKQFSVCSLK